MEKSCQRSALHGFEHFKQSVASDVHDSANAVYVENNQLNQFNVSDDDSYHTALDLHVEEEPPGVPSFVVLYRSYRLLKVVRFWSALFSRQLCVQVQYLRECIDYGVQSVQRRVGISQNEVQQLRQAISSHALIFNREH